MPLAEYQEKPGWGDVGWLQGEVLRLDGWLHRIYTENLELKHRAERAERTAADRAGDPDARRARTEAARQAMAAKTPEERREIARKAAAKRWGKS